MVAGATVIWVAVTLLALYAAKTKRPQWSVNTGYRLIIGGGVVLPTVVLAALLAYGLPGIGRLSPAPVSEALAIEVSGEWSWRVRYGGPAGPPVELANEIRLPVGHRTDVTLTSDNVIHAFWIPSLAGKVDMIPGRTTRISLEPTRTGRFRGVCAEYCGASHALMGFAVEVMERDAFDAWLTGQSAGAHAPLTSEASRGRDLFAMNGCAACHAIRGTSADGRIGPDLTHIGGRSTLAAAALPNQQDTMAQWIAAPHRSKPGVLMPAFDMLPAGDLQALAAYLSGLR